MMLSHYFFDGLIFDMQKYFRSNENFQICFRD
jgi:hypothetical protein